MATITVQKYQIMLGNLDYEKSLFSTQKKNHYLKHSTRQILNSKLCMRFEGEKASKFLIS